MKNILRLSLFLFLLNTVSAIELGPASEGYAWSKNLDGESAVLVQTDTLWLYIFESETKDSEKEWKVGEGMMKALMLNDEV